MGLLTEYFTAPDDARAAEVLRSSGPTSLGLTAVDAYGVEPYGHLGTLEEILTGRPYEQVAAGQTDPVAAVDGGEVMVVRLPDELVRALADLVEPRLGELARDWAAGEEFGGATDPEALADLLRGLGDLARARGCGAVYCWLSV